MPIILSIIFAYYKTFITLRVSITLISCITFIIMVSIDSTSSIFIEDQQTRNALIDILHETFDAQTTT